MWRLSIWGNRFGEQGEVWEGAWKQEKDLDQEGKSKGVWETGRTGEDYKMLLGKRKSTLAVVRNVMKVNVP